MKTIAAAFLLTLTLAFCVAGIRADVLPGGDDPPPRCLPFLTCDIDCYGPVTIVLIPGIPPTFVWSCAIRVEDPTELRDCIPFRDTNSDGVNDCKCQCRYIKLVVGGLPHDYCMCQL
jgi:hypothetical protein